jgi:hypothetical protein
MVSSPAALEKEQIGHLPALTEESHDALNLKALEVPLEERFSKHCTFEKLKPSDEAN